MTPNEAAPTPLYTDDELRNAVERDLTGLQLGSVPILTHLRKLLSTVVERQRDSALAQLAIEKDARKDAEEIAKANMDNCIMYMESELDLSKQLAAEKAAREAAEKERDEADRRAGAAERSLEYEKDTTFKRKLWLDDAKRAEGYSTNVSFDVVWEEIRKTRDDLRAQLTNSEAKVAELAAECARMRDALKSCRMEVVSNGEDGPRYKYDFDEGLVSAALSTPAHEPKEGK